MSQRDVIINEEAQGGDASGSQVPDSNVDVVITKVDGEWNIRLRNAALLQGQTANNVGEAKTNVEVMGASRLQVLGDDDSSSDSPRNTWFKKMRGWLMVVATVAASMTYQAGLNPPGGFWQDHPRDGSHHAGDPALHDEHRSRYLTFYYFNATAFVTSLVIIVLLMSERFYHTEAKVLALLFTTVVDLASLIGAYIAGTTRYFSSCIYIIVITCVSFVAVIYIGEIMVDICCVVMIMFPCMETLVQQNWCPIPKGVVGKAQKMKNEWRQRCAGRKNKERNSTGSQTFCSCCARAPPVNETV